MASSSKGTDIIRLILFFDQCAIIFISIEIDAGIVIGASKKGISWPYLAFIVLLQIPMSIPIENT